MTTNNQDRWSAIAATLFSQSNEVDVNAERHIRTAYGQIAPGVRVAAFEYRGALEKIKINRRIDDDTNFVTQVFFGDTGKAEEISTSYEVTQVFDNGIRRGPQRRSIHAVCTMTQHFNADGGVTEVNQALNKNFPGAYAELHIQTKEYVAGELAEVANSFFGYAFSEEGVVLAGVKMNDLTRSDDQARISVDHIHGVRCLDADLGVYLLTTSTNRSGIDLQLPNPDLIRVPYSVFLCMGSIGIELAGKAVGTIPLFQQIDLAVVGIPDEDVVISHSPPSLSW